jgi:dUTP pyrophosphatase
MRLVNADLMRNNMTDVVHIYRKALLHARVIKEGHLQAIEMRVAKTPERKTTEAAAYDIEAFLPEGPIELSPLTVVKVPTGLFVALPHGASFKVCSRSGLASKGVLVINAPGIIDSDYRDEICVLLSYIAPPGTPPFEIKHGDRVAQLEYTPKPPDLEFAQVEFQKDLPARETTRQGGFGSTGL